MTEDEIQLRRELRLELAAFLRKPGPAPKWTDRYAAPISREQGERNRRILAAAIGIDDYQAAS
jgi:hypothetical protein